MSDEHVGSVQLYELGRGTENLSGSRVPHIIGQGSSVRFGVTRTYIRQNLHNTSENIPHFFSS